MSYPCSCKAVHIDCTNYTSNFNDLCSYCSNSNNDCKVCSSCNKHRSNCTFVRDNTFLCKTCVCEMAKDVGCTTNCGDCRYCNNINSNISCNCGTCRYCLNNRNGNTVNSCNCGNCRNCLNNRNGNTVIRIVGDSSPRYIAPLSPIISRYNSVPLINYGMTAPYSPRRSSRSRRYIEKYNKYKKKYLELKEKMGKK